MTESTYLKMNKPEYSDQFDLAHWNENTDVVDNFYNDLVNTGSVKANKAVNDDAGNNISTTYATKTELNTAKSEIDTSLGQKELSANKVSAWQSAPDDTHYPTEKLVKDGLDGKANASQITDLQGMLDGKVNWYVDTEQPQTHTGSGTKEDPFIFTITSPPIGTFAFYKFQMPVSKYSNVNFDEGSYIQFPVSSDIIFKKISNTELHLSSAKFFSLFDKYTNLVFRYE